MAELEVNRVSVTDFDMPFLSMVRFMIKWAIASIPAVFIIMLAAALFWGVVFGAALSTIGASLLRRGEVQGTPQVRAPDTPTVAQGKPIEDEAAKAYLNRVIV